LTARGRAETPNTKNQAPEKLQIPRSNPKPRTSRLILEAWSFSGVWFLEFGVSNSVSRAHVRLLPLDLPARHRYTIAMVSAIIVAAGKGTRMGQNTDKLFMELAGRPVVAHTWDRFDAAGRVDEIILVVREGMQAAFQEMAEQYDLSKPFRLVAGGAERQDSVWNGLEAVSSAAEIVAIQDGARPCTSELLIEAVIAAARATGAAVAAQPVTDTIKESSDGKLIERTLDRKRLWAVQTPQAFRKEIIVHAISIVRERGVHVTDDTAACELIGQPVKLVPSASPNPKVTVPADLPYIESLLRQMG